MTPAYRLVAGGEDVTARIRRYLDELRVTSSSDRESDTLELTVSDEVDQVIGVPGEARELQVFLGYGDQLTPMGIYYRADVDIELVPRKLVVRATAADLRSRSTLKAPRTRSWDEVTLGALVAEIAAAHGYEARVDPSLAESPIAHVDQVAESDLHLLRRVVGHYDATLKAAAGHLVVLRRGSARTAGTGVPLPIVTVAAPPAGASTSIRGRVKVRGRARYGSVRASYYNTATAAVEYLQAGDREPTFVIRDPRPDGPQAKADAEARLLELHRRTGALELTLPGDPALVAESPLQLYGWGSNVDGPWIVNRASHVIAGSSGYTTEVQAETAPPTERPDTKTVASGPFQPVGGLALGAGGGGRSDAGGGGGGIPSVPDLRRVVERVAAQYPVDNVNFVPDVVQGLRAEGGPRWGFFRDLAGDIATDAVG